jgi:hypothetical protein
MNPMSPTNCPSSHQSRLTRPLWCLERQDSDTPMHMSEATGHGDGQHNTEDNGYIRVMYLDDVLFVRRGPDSISVDSIKADGGAALTDGE